MGFRELVDRIRHRAAHPYPSTRIPDGNVMSSTASPLPVITANSCYLEVRLGQMHLADIREWWRSFLPMGAVLTEVGSVGARRVAPFIVGAQALQEQLQGGPAQGGPAQVDVRNRRVDVRNRRVAGPVPYLGEDVRILATLCRTGSDNWAERALGLLETVAKLADVTRLTSLVSVAPAVVTGLESFLSMQQVELRLGVDRTLVPTPGGAAQEMSETGPVDPSDNCLRPGWWVMFGGGRVPVPELLHVQNDTLHVWDGQFVRPYIETDFLLLQVRALAARDDYQSFDFHAVHWNRVQDRLWDNELQGAQASFGAFAASLMQCPDLVRQQRRNLYLEYEGMYQQDLEQVRRIHDGTPHLDSRAKREELAESDLARMAVTPAAADWRRDVDMLLDAFST